MTDRILPKVFLTGDTSSGKSELGKALADPYYKFTEPYEPTNLIRIHECTNIEAEVIYTCTEMRTDRILVNVINNCALVLFCIDLTNKDLNIEELKQQLERIKLSKPDIKIVLVGTKADVDGTDKQAKILESFAINNKYQSVITSSKNYTEINTIKTIVEGLINNKVEDNQNHIMVTTKFESKGQDKGDVDADLPNKTNIDYSTQTLQEIIETLDSSENNVPQTKFYSSLKSLTHHLSLYPDINIENATRKMVIDYKQLLDSDKVVDKKVIAELFHTYELACADSWKKTTLKLVGACIITGMFSLLGIAIGGTLGLLVGVSAAAITGPGGLITGGIGMASGGITGWAIGIATAAAVTGITLGAVGSSVTGISIFEPNPFVAKVVNKGKELSIS